MPQSIGDLAQLVLPLYDRFHFSGLEKLSQERHIRLVEVREKENDLLAATECSPGVTFEVFHTTGVLRRRMALARPF